MTRDQAMFAVRIAISVFVVVLLTVIGIGLNWTASHQPPAAAAASRVVLAAAGLFGLAGLFTIWRPGSRQTGGRS
jgi:hypothetical protein